MRYCARYESEKQTKKEREGGREKVTYALCVQGCEFSVSKLPVEITLRWDEMLHLQHAKEMLCKNKKSQQITGEAVELFDSALSLSILRFTFQIIDSINLSGQMAAAYKDVTKVFVQGDIVWIHGKWVVYPVASVHLL